MKTTPRARRNSKLIFYPDSSDDDCSITSVMTKKKATNKAIQIRRTMNERKLRNASVFNGGRWSKQERLNFLRGLRKFGPGKWKMIQTILTTRSNIQIKSHGQKILQRIQAGDNVYEELEAYEGGIKKFPSPPPSPTKEDVASLISSPPSSPSPCPSLDEEEETASMVSEVSFSGKETMMPVSPPKVLGYVNLQSSMEPRRPSLVPSLEPPRLPMIPSPQDHLRRMAKKPVFKKKTSQGLSIKEATVVLALVELSDPIKLNTKVAAI